MLKGYDVVYFENGINSLKRYLEGRVLTITDACVSDPEQRKAVKDLIREAMWSQEGWSKSMLNVIDNKPPYEDNYQDIKEIIKDTPLTKINS